MRAARKSDPELFKDEEVASPAPSLDLPTSQVVVKSESDHPPVDEDAGLPTPRINPVFRSSPDLLESMKNEEPEDNGEWANAPFENTAPRPIVVLGGEDDASTSSPPPAVAPAELARKGATDRFFVRLAVTCVLAFAIALVLAWRFLFS